MQSIIGRKIGKSIRVETSKKRRKAMAKAKTTTKTANKAETLPQEMPRAQGSQLPGRKGMPGTHAMSAPHGRAMPASASRQAQHHLANLSQAPGYVDATEFEGDEPNRTETLPAVISQALIDTHANINPEWYAVSQLPANIQPMIKRLGKEVFSQFTTTPTEDIQSVSQLSNPDIEVRAMYAWIKKHGHKVSDVDMDFGVIMPGYEAQAEIWLCNGFEFMLVKDFAGYYVYGWDADSAKNIEGASKRDMIEMAKSLKQQKLYSTVQEAFRAVVEQL
jgi:hypothetical protein